MKLPELRRVRELRGMTMEELARASGVSVGTIVNLDAHHREGRLSTARKLAEALGVSIATLVGEEELPGRAFTLAAMHQESDAERKHAMLEAATPGELARYLRDIDRMLAATIRQQRSPEHQEPGEQAGLAKQMQELLDLREEAEPYIGDTPQAQEMGAHTSVPEVA